MNEVTQTFLKENPSQSIEEISLQNIKLNALKDLQISKKPDDVTISTMTIVCSVATIFNCGNIARYIELKYDGVLSVTHGIAGDPKTNRSIVFKKKPTGKQKKKKNIFFNQVSMYVAVKEKKKNPVNVKIFSNGAIQMTGCKTVDTALEVLKKLLSELKSVKGVINYKEMKIIEKPFATVPSALNTENIKNFKIAMINSNFVVPFKIDRPKLYNLLLLEQYDCLYDPIKHACVNIKYEHPDKSISIFVFERGPIIITGARNCEQILAGYNFIYKYLLNNFKQIVKNDALTNSSIVKYLEMY